MAKTMTTSEMTDGQIERAIEIFRAQLRKHKGELPSTAVQTVLGQAELGPEWLAVLRNRVKARIRATEPHILKRQPFDPVKFIGKGWTIDEQVGERTGDNLDAGEIVRKDYLKSGESSINGEERLKRIKAAPGDVQLDADDFLALYREDGQKTLKWLYETRGITWLSFWGTILRHPRGDRRVLYLDRRGGGSWDWNGHWVVYGLWIAGYPAAVLASSK